ncbi:MAG: hypothetical protein F4246_02125 [Rhodothermaceae bacterium]|nr:hypothetical protein [Rhodothermaceae bacterium]MXX58982.1 hypothetical protein [Rhodothermaceae bacterium]MYD20376.1 hypothetical protein [Rhodothermaceae bacterium]MYD55792.1 hypothetical protein [Rhodothermaceae bacterium]MYI43987.1 hypothetical protein [Rhodothermaceae bacterium]
MSDEPIEGASVQIISPSDLEKSLSPDPAGGQRYITKFDSQSLESWTAYEHYLGVRQHYQHKGRWSKFLLGAIASMIGYQMALLVLVGLGILDFKGYDWLLPGLLVQNLAQIVGLALYAVKHLFSDITLKNGDK